MPNPYPDKEALKDCSVYDKLLAHRRCYSFHQQFLNYYRYGSKRDCADEWEEVKLCMSVKLKPEDVKEKMIREFQEKKEEKLKNRPSSLDVWSLREQKLENFPPE